MSKPKEFLVIEKSVLDAITRQHPALRYKLHCQSSNLEFWMGKAYEEGFVSDDIKLKQDYLKQDIDL